MPLFCKDDQAVLFKHIPKTAGSSIETAFQQSGWKMSLWDKTYKTPPCCAQHWHHSVCVENKVYNRNIDYEFAVVRHPYTRLFSEYFHTHKSTKVPAVFDDAIMRNIDNFFVKNFQGHIKAGTRCHRDNHYRPQHEFIGPDTEIFKFEQLSGMWSKLKVKYQLQNLTHQRSRGNNHYPTQYAKHSDKFKQLYTQLYAKDHEQFNYQLPF